MNNLNLEREYFGERLGWAYVHVPCKACGVQYDRREVEEYTQLTRCMSRNLCAPRGTWGKRDDAGQVKAEKKTE